MLKFYISDTSSNDKLPTVYYEFAKPTLICVINAQ